MAPTISNDLPQPAAPSQPQTGLSPALWIVSLITIELVIIGIVLYFDAT